LPSTVLRTVAVLFGACWLALGLSRRESWPIWPLVTFAVVLAGLAFHKPTADKIERGILALPARAFTALMCAAAAGSSLWVVYGPMRNRPLAIDAAVYLMEARALSHGHFGMPVSAPLLHASNRFLLEGPDGHIYGVFPPGYPLFLVPLVLLGLEMLSGPILAVLLVLAQSALARALGAGELPRRLALVMCVLSFARAMETADLLSHALCALLVTCALTVIVPAHRALSTRAALFGGACVGLCVAARMLDGAVLVVGFFAVLAWRRDVRGAALALVGAAPFLALLLLEQHAAMGEWGSLTQSVYFARSDWPPNCHNLGFGKNRGCTVEHALWMPLMGNDGYQAGDVLRVLRERGVAFGQDLFGVAPLGVLVFALAVRRPRIRDVLGGAFVFAFAMAYGLFYFGNVPFYGARHLFPVALLAWVLVGRSIVHVWRGRAGALAGASIAAIVAGQGSVWRTQTGAVADYMHARHDLRAAAQSEPTTSGIVYSSDITGVVAAYDSWESGESLFLVQDDRSGLLELRRAHPDLPVYKALDDDRLAKLVIGPPPPGLLVELERAWPSFQRQHGLGARPAEVSYVKLSPTSASGRAALFVSHASPGTWLEIPFATVSPGTWSLRIDAIVGPDYGEWSVSLDGTELGTVNLYGEELAIRKGESLGSHLVGAGRHTLVLRSEGKDIASRGFDGAFDALVGTRD
jgi:hypothetical protein